LSEVPKPWFSDEGTGGVDLCSVGWAGRVPIGATAGPWPGLLPAPLPREGEPVGGETLVRDACCCCAVTLGCGLEVLFVRVGSLGPAG
jgi:hypothetical protein